MSPFIVEISDHAGKRLKQRKITRSQIRRCLTVGTRVLLDLNGRKTKRLKIGTRVLEVIYLDIKGGYQVITTFWKGEHT